MYGHTKFKSQITCYKYLGVGYKDLTFCRNNSLIMENMDKEFTVPKWANNTPNASKHFSPKYLPKPKSSRFLKKSSLWVSLVRCAAAAHHMKAVFCRQFSSHVLKPDAES